MSEKSTENREINQEVNMLELGKLIVSYSCVHNFVHTMRYNRVPFSH
jgi:hypothetical protein